MIMKSTGDRPSKRTTAEEEVQMGLQRRWASRRWRGARERERGRADGGEGVVAVLLLDGVGRSGGGNGGRRRRRGARAEEMTAGCCGGCSLCFLRSSRTTMETWEKECGFRQRRREGKEEGEGEGRERRGKGVGRQKPQGLVSRSSGRERVRESGWRKVKKGQRPSLGRL